MRSKRTYQHKKIKNSPIRSPSPDYVAKNRNPETSDLQLSQIHNKSESNNASPVKFPHIPKQLLKSKTPKEFQNTKPHSNLSKMIRQNSDITPQISIFKQSYFRLQENDIMELFSRIEEIHRILVLKQDLQALSEIKQFKSNQKIQFQLIKHKLNEIRSQIFSMKKFSNIDLKNISMTNFDTFGIENSFTKRQMNHIIRRNQSSLIDSPISKIDNNQQDLSFSVSRINELQLQNSKLKRQLVILKLELQDKQKRNYSASKVSQTYNRNFEKSPGKSFYIRKSKTQLNNNISQSNIKQEIIQEKSSQAFKFLKQKIRFLENQLQNKINRIAIIQKQKNLQVELLQQKLKNSNKIVEPQIQNFKKVKQSLKKKTTYFQQNKDRFYQFKQIDRNMVTPKRSRLNSEQINGDNFMNKQQILSLYDKSQQPRIQQSLYSEAEKIDIQQFYPGKKQHLLNIQKIKEYYEQIISFNLSKYHSQLQKLQDQLRQLKQFIKNFNLQGHETHSKCSNCQQLNMNLIKRDVQIFDKQNQINVLKQQVERQKIQSQKLRQLLHISAEIQRKKSQASDKKFKRKGAFEKASYVKQRSVGQSQIQIRSPQSMKDLQHESSFNVKHSVSLQGGVGQEEQN